MPVCFVIFGITGDLSRSKLIPAIFNLYLKGLLPSKFKVVGYSRREITREDFHNYVKEIIGKDDQKFLSHFIYVQGQFNEAADYGKLVAALAAVDEEEFKECSNKLFYLAVPPEWYAIISKHLSSSGLTIPCGGRLGWTRILVEKPFGRDINTARKLNLTLGKLFKEEQIFRIDHYLGKSASQNIWDFRFKKGKLEKFWNSKYIDRVEIELMEKDGVKNRGAFYDQIGALRDVGQNHLLQMLALVAMKKPKTFRARDIQKERAKVLESISIFTPPALKKNIQRAQYKGYLGEKGVAKNSKTETFFSLILKLRNKNWQGVPFLLRSGKALNENRVGISIYFKKRPADLNFDYSKQKQGRTADAYEKVLLDCVLGDQTIFTSTGEVEAAWKFITPILKNWKKLLLIVYRKGTTPKY